LPTKAIDSDRFRNALSNLDITPCITGRSNRKKAIYYDKDL